MAILDEIKTELDILATDITKDVWINLQVRKGSTLITNYLNATPTVPPVDISVTYPDALIEYVTLCYRKRGNEGIKQFAQGSRSGTYESGLPDTVKDLLPCPSIQMMGVRGRGYA